ncbi:MAG: hypothetical protein COB04_11900 [Gammaproteobacteria bacterium]|nr:MAG: hypothetical protein COB04_11900 [Gammaproteobacteria bacterium]
MGQTDQTLNASGESYVDVLSLDNVSELPDYNSKDIVCQCLSIKRVALTSYLAREREPVSIDDFVYGSGAGSVCSSCNPLLREMLGEEVWVDATIGRVESLSADVKSFQFWPVSGVFYPAKAGQHILLQVYVNGCWEMRRYSLTTPEGETRFREVCVKKQANGVVSNWLHAMQCSEKRIRISQPFGDVTPDIVSSSTLICLVAGVGVTPAISIARSVGNRLGGSRKLILDYSVSRQSDFIFFEALTSIANKQPLFDAYLRVTNDSNYLDKTGIFELVSQHPCAEFYICGPESYAQAMDGYLAEAGVDSDRVMRECFSTPGQRLVDSKALDFIVGSALLVLFVTQDLLNLKLFWLESWQLNDTYRVYSGLLVLLYVLSQFILPYNKSCKVPHVTAKFYKRHKFRGALAPLVFFIHSTHMGVAYLSLLSLVYFSNFAVGLFNHERIKSTATRMAYFKVWLPTHVLLSVLLLGLMVFHVYIVASY